MKIIVVPEYIEKFKCIGPNCEDDCCHGWCVYIDKETYEKYLKIKDEEMKQKFKNYLQKNKNCTSNFNFAVMNMKENGQCPMQDENMLCTIHKNYGAELLSYTCWLYPKWVNHVGPKIEISLAMSCPEAARKVLFEREKIKFLILDNKKIDKNRIDVACKNITNNEMKSGFNSLLMEIRGAAIEILQNRESKIIERILYLGFMIKKISEQESETAIKECIKNYIENMREVKELKISKDLPENKKVQFEMLKSIFIARNGLDFKFKEIYEKSEPIFHFEEECSEEILKNYEKSYFKYIRRFLNENEHIMENFLVNTVFQRVFPFGSEIFDSYVELVLEYMIFRTILLVMAFEKGELNNEVITEGVYKFSRAFEHSKQFMTDTIKNIKESGYATLPYMCVFMK